MTNPPTYPTPSPPRRSKIARYLGGPCEHETLIHDIDVPWPAVIVMTGGLYRATRDERGRALYVWEHNPR